MANVHDMLRLTRGDSWPLSGALTNADGTPFNLAVPATVTWRMLTLAGDVVLSLASPADISITDTAGGLCQFVLTPAQTRALAPGIYEDELRATSAAGVVSTQWRGGVVVIDSAFEDPA